MRHIWLVRHGNRLDFARPEWLTNAQRPHDCPISPNGEIQARDTGARLKAEAIAHIFSSPFIRAAQTASIIGQALELPVKIEPGLSEMLLDRWFPADHDLLDAAALARMFSNIDLTYRPQVAPEYPETTSMMFERTARIVELLRNQYRGNLVFVGHGGSFTGIGQALAGRPCRLHATTCCLIRFEEIDGRAVLAADGTDTSHLSWVEPDLRFN